MLAVVVAAAVPGMEQACRRILKDMWPLRHQRHRCSLAVVLAAQGLYLYRPPPTHLMGTQPTHHAT